MTTDDVLTAIVAAEGGYVDNAADKVLARRSSAARNPLARRPIIALNLIRRPSDIALFVVAVIVDAVDRMLPGRTAANIAKKRTEVTAPLVAHPNTATAIDWILRVVAVVAPRFSVLPRLIFSALSAPSLLSMRRAALAEYFGAQATATLRRAALKCVTVYDARRATRAMTPPLNPAASAHAVSNRFDDGQSAARSASHVSHSHGLIIPNFDEFPVGVA